MNGRKANQIAPACRSGCTLSNQSGSSKRYSRPVRKHGRAAVGEVPAAFVRIVGLGMKPIRERVPLPGHVHFHVVVPAAPDDDGLTGATSRAANPSTIRIQPGLFATAFDILNCNPIP